MGETCTVVIPFRGKKDLSLLFQMVEGLAVQDSVPVPLIDRADQVLGFFPVPSERPAAE